MTTGILNSIKFRDTLYLKLKSLHPGTDHHHKIDSYLKSHNTILKKLIRQTKIHYHTEQFNKNKSNIRHTLSTINENLNKCKNKRDFHASSTINGQDIDDKYDIGNQFNSFLQV